MYETPSTSGNAYEANQSGGESAAEVLALAIEELQGKLSETRDEAEKAQDAAELSALRRADTALKNTGGNRQQAIAWLKEQAATVVNPEDFEAAVKWLEHLQD